MTKFSCFSGLDFLADGGADFEHAITVTGKDQQLFRHARYRTKRTRYQSISSIYIAIIGAYDPAKKLLEFSQTENFSRKTFLI